MKVYLDNCCFNRPYDNQSQLLIKLETEAKLRIQEWIKDQKILLVWSFMLDYENSANPGSSKRNAIFEWFRHASEFVEYKDEILLRAQQFVDRGFGKKDSIHLSCAIAGSADYFITVDKGILNKDGKLSNIRIIDTVAFIRIAEEIL